MPVSSRHLEVENTLEIHIRGRFDFPVYSEFRNAYLQGDSKTRYVIDLEQIEYLDSSALGMMLLLRDHAGGETADITLRNCRPELLRILTVARFNDLFKLCSAGSGTPDSDANG